MRSCFMGLALCAMAFSQGRGQPRTQARTYTAPRTADGKPDLQGIWQAMNTASYNVEPHSPQFGIRAGTGVITDPTDGMIPYLPAAAEKRKQNFENRAAADPLNKCYLPGIPRLIYLPYPIQIVQTPKYVLVTSEFGHAVHTVFMEGKHLPEIDLWMGDARGRWEGETLVVDVVDHNDQTWLDQSGNFHSDALHVIERFTRTEPDLLTYEAMLEDSKVYSRPWKISMPLYLHKGKNLRLLEYECSAYLEDQAAQKEGRP